MLIMTSAICVASPLVSYSPGDFTIGLNLNAPTLSTNSWTTDGKLSVGYDVSAGIGLGFAGQYLYRNFKTNDNIEIKEQQLNLIKSEIDIFGGNIALFVGVSKTESIDSISCNGIVAGIMGTIPIAPNTYAFTAVNTGTRIKGYEVGIGYLVAKNTDLNLGYRDKIYNGLTSEDITAKSSFGEIRYYF